MYRRRRKRRLNRLSFVSYRALGVLRRLSPGAWLISLGVAVAVLTAVALLVFLPRNTDALSRQIAEDVLVAANAGVIPDGSAANPESTPDPAPDPAPTSTPDPTLQRNDENERVQKLQERLMDLCYLDIDESTQFFGPATEYAVQLFQRQHKLQQDGIAGLETLTLLYSEQAKKYTLLEGTKGTDVDSLQRQLKDLGYLKKATGYYGTETVAAVKDFQERNDLKIDGKTGQYTLDLIYSPNAKPSKFKVQAEHRRANILTMLSAAADQLGDPYVLGNEGPNSFDCSGLVYYCLKEAGSSRGRYNAAGYAQVKEWDKITSMGRLEKGDLLFFWNKGKTKVGHVGIYIGSGMMIDASSSNDRVIKRPCNTAYWMKMFVFARRPW
ncbi:MAG: peptidoglycan-binding protein [Christensenellales bacterium]|jgi:cell wall-associated NlpC family hydrolase